MRGVSLACAMTSRSAPLRILTWHVHGNYLWYLSQTPHEFYVPFKPGRPPGYGGRAGTFPWPDNLHELAADDVRNHDFDCILYQTHANYLSDQYEILSEAQRRLPKIALEHDPPIHHPTDQQHPVDDPNVLVVHVTHFNALMWNSGRSPVRVIEHGVLVPADVRHRGDIDRGVVVINNLAERGRRLGADVFMAARERVPLDLVGMDALSLGGVGEIDPPQLPEFVSRYRFFFNPIRHTSLGLAIIEAMMVGLPIVGLATTELSTVIENGVSGYVDTNLDRLVAVMRDLLADPAEARRLGENARRCARERFDIGRFTRDWDETFRFVTGARQSSMSAGTSLRTTAGVAA